MASLRLLSEASSNTLTKKRSRGTMIGSNKDQTMSKDHYNKLRENDFINIENIHRYIEKAFAQDIVPTSKKPALLRFSRRPSPATTHRSGTATSGKILNQDRG